MPNQHLFAVSVEACADTLNLLEEAFPSELGAITWIGENADCDGRLDWFRQDRSEAEDLAATVRSRLATEGLTAEVVVRKIPAEDWSESWKRHFPVIHVSTRLVIAPPWAEVKTLPGLQVVRLEPGLSFGTGQHATTKACLYFLDRLYDRLPGPEVIDIGCGSGILAIAAAKLGFARVFAMDNDSEAVRVAHENAIANGVAENIAFVVGDLEKNRPFPPCRVVLANILASVLIEQAVNVRAMLSNQPGSGLVLSGILEEQYNAVADTYAALNLREAQRLTIEGWTTGCFEPTFCV